MSHEELLRRLRRQALVGAIAHAVGIAVLLPMAVWMLGAAQGWW